MQYICDMKNTSKMVTVEKERKLKFDIKRLMLKNRTSLKDLAQIMNVTYQTAWNYINICEDEDKSIPGDQMKKVADHFGVKMEELYKR